MTVRDRKPNKVKIRGVAANAVVGTTQSTPEDVAFTNSKDGQVLLKNMNDTLAQNPNYSSLDGEFPTLNADGTINIDKTLEMTGYARTPDYRKTGEYIKPTGEEFNDTAQYYLSYGNTPSLNSMIFNRVKLLTLGNSLAETKMQQQYLDKIRSQINTPNDVAKVMKKEYKEIDKLLEQLRIAENMFYNRMPSSVGRKKIDSITNRIEAKMNAIQLATGFVPNNKITNYLPKYEKIKQLARLLRLEGPPINYNSSDGDGFGYFDREMPGRYLYPAG